MNPQPNTPASLNEAVAGKALQNVYMTLAEVPCECSARRREESEHLSGCHLFDLCAAIDALAAPGAAIDAREQEVDPMDWPLPCDVTVGHGTMRKGVTLRTLVLRMKTLYEMATGNDADVIANRTPEERKALADEFLAAVSLAQPLEAWCCEKGQAAGKEVCDECAEESRGYSAAMAPAPDDTPLEMGEGDAHG